MANDFATTGDVMRHAAEELNIEDALCCIYATAPFIIVDDLKAGYETLLDASAAPQWDYVFSATRFSFPIQRALKQNADNAIAMFEPENELTRSQDLEPAFHDAGQFYWGRSAAFKKGLPVFTSRSTIVELPNWRVQDIDTQDDWVRAEAMFKTLGLGQK